MKLTRETIIGLLPKLPFSISDVPMGVYEYEYEDDRMAVYRHRNTGALYNIKMSDFKSFVYRSKPMLWSIPLKDSYRFVPTFTVLSIEMTGQYPITAYANFSKYVDKLESGQKLSRRELQDIYSSEIITPERGLRSIRIDTPVII